MLIIHQTFDQMGLLDGLPTAGLGCCQHVRQSGRDITFPQFNPDFVQPAFARRGNPEVAVDQGVVFAVRGRDESDLLALSGH